MTVWGVSIDWDVVTLVVMAVAGVSVMYAEFKRDREIIERLIDIHQRVAALETAHNPPPDLTEILARLAVIEARLNFQPVKHTVRRKDGKFGKVDEAK